MITFNDFKKVDLRVAKILKAEKVENAEKLLKLEVDLGSEKRQIIAGIAANYSPEELVGKNIVIVCNLEPKILFGLESQGMLLAAENKKELALLTLDKDITPGTRIC